MAKKQEDRSALQQLKLSLREKNVDRLYIFHGEEIFLQGKEAYKSYWFPTIVSYMILYCS